MDPAEGESIFILSLGDRMNMAAVGTPMYQIVWIEDKQQYAIYLDGRPVKWFAPNEVNKALDAIEALVLEEAA